MPDAAFPIGRRITLPGHFAEPVALESVRPLGEGCECRVRLADGSLEEVVLSPEETRLICEHGGAPEKTRLVDACDLQLLVESARIRLAYPAGDTSAAAGEPQAAADFLKSTYQVEVRRRCQQERQQLTQVIRDYLERSFKARIRKAQNRYMTLMGELGRRPEYKLAADEAKRNLDDLERNRKDRLAGLDRLQIARTGPVRHLATAVVFPPGADIARVMEQWGFDADPESRRRKELAAEKVAVEDLVAEGFPRELIQRVATMPSSLARRTGSTSSGTRCRPAREWSRFKTRTGYWSTRSSGGR